MSCITFIRDFNKISCKAEDHLSELLGKFFITDIAFMPDFMHAFLNSPLDECIKLEFCTVCLENDYLVITPLQKETAEIAIRCDKTYFLKLLTMWEHFLFSRVSEFSMNIDEKKIIIQSPALSTPRKRVEK